MKDFTYNKPMPTNWHKPHETYVDIYKDMFDGTHLLIGGETGSGKSTVLNGIMLAAITTKSPSEAMFYLIDTKEVELTQYKDLPHTIRFITEAEDVPDLLGFVCQYMDMEYHRMAEVGIRKSENPHMYIVIDEIADLMLSQYASQIKRGLQRILQKGRACNIHVIACTQSPSRRTLPAEVQINFTDRVALHCASAIESRQILNEKGAENIQGFGTVLYKAPMKKTKEHSGLPFYSDAEIARRVKFWTDQIPVRSGFCRSDNPTTAPKKRSIVTRTNGGFIIKANIGGY